jgi:hypothetical protein
MKHIENLFNIVHYTLYKIDYKLHFLFNKVNPALLLGRIPALRRKFEEQGTTYIEVVNKLWIDKRYGFGIILSGGGLLFIVFLVLISLYTILNGLLSQPMSSSLFPFVLSLLFSYLICYYRVFKDDKYLLYFKKYDKWSKKDKIKNHSISFVMFFISITLFVFSFRYLIVK